VDLRPGQRDVGDGTSRAVAIDAEEVAHDGAVPGSHR
jgi:hypothetical protein